jgi:hypothetical protein
MASSSNSPPFQHLNKNAQRMVVSNVMSLKTTLPERYVWPAATDLFNASRHGVESRYQGRITTEEFIELLTAMMTKIKRYNEEVKKYEDTGDVYNEPNVISNASTSFIQC